MLIFVLGALLAAAPSIEVNRQTWDTPEGLPQSSVTAVAQDGRGFLVLGTFAGLAQFDGRSLESIDPATTAGWSGLRVTAIATDAAGHPWVGTQDGRVLQLHGGELSEHSVPQLFADHAIWSISWSGSAGREEAWVASPRGAARWDGETWTVLRRPLGVNVVLAHQGVAWLGSHTGLERIEDGHAEPVQSGVGEVLSLCASDAGIVVGGIGGVARVTADAVVSLEDVPAGHVACAKDGSVWAGRGDALRRVGTDAAFRFSHPVRSLFEDRERNLWVGTDGGGVTRVIREDWSVSATPSGALPILQLPDDSLLVGGFCGEGGLFRIGADGDLRTTVSGECVRALASDERGVLVGLDSQIMRWSEDSGLEPVADVGHPILVLHPSPEGLWVGTDTGGAFRVRQGAVESVDVGDARVLSILSGAAPKKGSGGPVTWFGTHRGLTRLDGSGQRRWTAEDGVPRGPIRGLLEDADGTLFLASYGGGLGIFRDGAFRRIASADGLGDNAISSVVDDGRGALWINGNRGVTRVRRADLEAWLSGAQPSSRMRRWNTPEGNGGGQPSGAVLRDGTVAFPTAKGVLRISPERVFRNPVEPRIVLESADVDGAGLVPGDTVQIPPGPGRVFVDFTAATLRHPELATLEVRLREVGSSQPAPWEISTDGHARWGGVRAGTYEIELRATNEDAAQSETMVLRFELAPYWHQRVSFWAGVGLLSLMGGLILHRRRTGAIAARNRELQREVSQRIAAEQQQQRIARRLSAAERMEAVGRLAGGIAHDFNNLLTAVAGTSTVLREIHAASEVDEQGATLIDNLDRCVERGAGLTQSLLAFAGKQSMEPSATHADALVRRLLPMLRTSLRDDIELCFVPGAAAVGTLVDPAMLELAILNLVLNAQAALPAGGQVDLVLERVDAAELATRFPEVMPAATGDWALIVVRDDGEGMSPEQLARAREPYFTTRADGNGLGLPSVEGFASQSGGAMHLASVQGDGATVTLVLPFIAPPDIPTPVKNAPPRARGAGRILLCDDDDLVRSSLEVVFRRAGYETLSFDDPRTLLQEVGPDTPFDILVTDVLMPGMTGDELARRVKNRRPGLPVVFMSGYTDDIRTDALGGPLLRKPFRSAEAVRAVAQTLGTATDAP